MTISTDSTDNSYYSTHNSSDNGTHNSSHDEALAASESLFYDLRKAILTIENDNDKAALLQSVQEMQSALKTSAVVQKYQDFVEQGKDYVTLLCPFFPELTKLFTG